MSKMYTNRYRIVQCVCWSFRLFSVCISVACSGSVPPLASAIQSVCVRHPIGLRPPSNRFAFAAQSDCVRHPIGLRPPSNRFAFAAQSDCVRHPIGLRPPSNRFAFAAQSDCVRSPIRLRSVSDAKISTATALTLRLLFANTRLLLSKRK